MKIYNIELKFTCVQESSEVDALIRPETVVAYMAGAFDQYPEQESFWVIPLNNKGFPKGRHMISLGIINGTVAHPREVFRTAILASAASIIVVHNHPSGDPAPSSADISMTRKLREAGEMVGIPLRDHVVIGDQFQDPLRKGFFSFSEAGYLTS